MNIKVLECNSSITTGKGITITKMSDVIEQFGTYNFIDGFVLFNIDDRIMFGRVMKNNISFIKEAVVNFPRLKSVRCFNDKQELLLFKESSQFNYRFRNDIKGEICEFVESSNIIFGTAKDESFNQPLFTKIREDRGIEIILPIEINEVNEHNRIKILVRNYIGYNNFSQASYIDYRFVRFVGGKNE